jgi:hypothetical protein
MNLAGVISSLASGTYTVTRKAASSYLVGRQLSAATVATLTITAVVHPLTGKELARLPEGMRTKELKVVITATELKTQGSSQEPDSIVIGSDTFEVQTVEAWQETGGYYKAVVAKVGR